MAQLRLLLQQPRRCHLLAEEMPGVAGQAEVPIHEGHEGERFRQPRELRFLRGRTLFSKNGGHPSPGVSTRTMGAKTHQDVTVHPCDGDQPVLPCRTHAWGLLDADIHDFGKVTEGLESLRKKGRSEAGGLQT